MTSKEAQTLVASATALARNDLVAEGQDACSERGPARDPDPRPRIRVEPLKVFDNLYFIGFEQIGAWVLRTTDGLILFDTLNTPMEAETVLEPDMRQLGLDPADIKYIILSHGHRDHYGGAPYFQQKLRDARSADRGRLGPHGATANGAGRPGRFRCRTASPFRPSSTS